jgi:hypothetical protein
VCVIQKGHSSLFLLPSSFVARARQQAFSSGRKKEEGRRKKENADFIAFELRTAFILPFSEL